MGTLFRLNPEGVSPAPGTKIIRSDAFGAFVDAAGIVLAAREQAARTAEEAHRAYEAEKQRGYDDGLEEGRLENAEKMMDTILSSVEFIEKIEDTVVDVVSQSVRKIIGELDERERIVRIVKTALSHVRGQQKITIRVAPADEPAVSEALAAMTSGSYIDIVADPRLERDSCTLESELGVVEASLETQLKALEHAFQSKIRK